MNYLKTIWEAAYQSFDADVKLAGEPDPSLRPEQIDWQRTLPFIFLHLGCLLLLVVGWNFYAAIVALFLYFIRMFAITGFYHRYFSHRTFKTSRIAQFLFALLGNSSMQRGPLWWAATHRHHHRFSDQEGDVHSPTLKGFLWSHIGWLTSMRNFPTDYERVPDLARYPELVFLNRYDKLVPIAYGVLMVILGVILSHFFPAWHLSVGQFFVWTFFISTTFLLHGTLAINSMAHVWGKKRYVTSDESRNSFLLSLITLGEGWHNNHHRYQHATRQGFFWWELDLTYYGLKVLSWFGIIWDLRPVPQRILEEGGCR